MHERVSQHHRSVRAAVVVSRPPWSAGAVDLHRLVAHEGCEMKRRLRQRGEIDRGLDDRTDRADGIERTIESGAARVAVSHDGQHFAGPSIRHRNCRLELAAGSAASSREERHRLLEGCLGGALNRGIEGGEDSQSLAAQHAARVVPPELPAHQIDERRENAPMREAAASHSQRLVSRALRRRRASNTPGFESIDHPIPSPLRPLGMTARVVVRRTAHHAGEQCHLVKVEIRERAPEVVAGGAAETVNRMCALLAEVHLVQVPSSNSGLE